MNETDNSYLTTLSLSGALSYSCHGFYLMGFQFTCLNFQDEIDNIRHEYQMGLYQASSYILARSAANFWLHLSMTTAFVSVIYYGIGLALTFNQLSIFFGILLLNLTCSSSFGMMLNCFCNSVEEVHFLQQVLTFPAIELGGFFVNVHTLPVIISWMQYMSPIRFSFEAILRNEFDTRDFQVGEYSPVEYLTLDVGFKTCIFAMIAWTVFNLTMTIYLMHHHLLRKNK